MQTEECFLSKTGGYRSYEIAIKNLFEAEANNFHRLHIYNSDHAAQREEMIRLRYSGNLNLWGDQCRMKRAG
jgi:hypothetical protein